MPKTTPSLGGSDAFPSIRRARAVVLAVPGPGPGPLPDHAPAGMLPDGRSRRALRHRLATLGAGHVQLANVRDRGAHVVRRPWRAGRLRRALRSGPLHRVLA